MLDGIPKKTWYAGLMEVVNRLMVKGKSASEIEQALYITSLVPPKSVLLDISLACELFFS